MRIIPIILIVYTACPNREQPDSTSSPTVSPKKTLRIVSTAPSVTEILFELGLGPQIVAVSDYCQYPPAAKDLPRVGSYIRPSIERIVALRPDLVLLDDVQTDAALALQTAGVRAIRLPLRTLDDVRESIGHIAAAANVPSAGASLSARLAAELARAPRLRGSPKVLLVIGRDSNTFRNLYAAGTSGYAGELLARAGGKNVLVTSMPYPKIAVETIVALAPDVIVEVVDVALDAKAARRDWDTLSSVPAVRNRRVFVTSDQLLTTPGPRAPAALRNLVSAIDGNSPAQ